MFFDCDGVLGDTEQFGHLVAFNQMWREFGVPWSWSVEEYGRKLAISGGRERMRSLFGESEFLAVFEPPEPQEARDALILKWHKRKTDLHTEIIESGRIPPRSGVKRIAEAALGADWLVGVCSTSAREAVQAMINHVMGEETASRLSLVLTSESVQAKKPAPDIYNLAATRLGASPSECLVIEDSNNGLEAAKSAGMKCLVTLSAYTRDEDFSAADLVVTCLGDPDGEKTEVLQNRSAATPVDWVVLADLTAILEGGLRHS